MAANQRSKQVVNYKEFDSDEEQLACLEESGSNFEDEMRLFDVSLSNSSDDEIEFRNKNSK